MNSSFWRGFIKQASSRGISPQQLLKAVIIKGNPKWINNNPQADLFYNQIADHLRQKNYDVSFDAGEPHTQPANADLWVGHSRGVDRLRFAPKGTKTVDLTPFEHPVSKAFLQRRRFDLSPPLEHYLFTDEMKNHL